MSRWRTKPPIAIGGHAGCPAAQPAGAATTHSTNALEPTEVSIDLPPLGPRPSTRKVFTARLADWVSRCSVVLEVFTGTEQRAVPCHCLASIQWMFTRWHRRPTGRPSQMHWRCALALQPYPVLLLYLCYMLYIPKSQREGGGSTCAQVGRALGVSLYHSMYVSHVMFSRRPSKSLSFRSPCRSSACKR